MSLLAEKLSLSCDSFVRVRDADDDAFLRCEIPPEVAWFAAKAYVVAG
jgi:hypothetical protein